MTLPLALSVPHAGLRVPEDLADRCLLLPEQLERDGDVGAAEIYALEAEVQEFVTTTVARAVLDLNRGLEDFHKDGVIKTHTCYDEPVWREPLSQKEIRALFDAHWQPYHDRLAGWHGAVKLAVDCHTMAAIGPPVAPDPGARRPLVCLGDARGAACPRPWVDALVECFGRHFGTDQVTLNAPFAGGYITRTHGGEQPWVQVELSRCEERMSRTEKRAAVLAALTDWCALELPRP